MKVVLALAVVFAEREASKIPKLARNTLSIDIVSVLGAGTMGSGIAANCLNVAAP